MNKNKVINWVIRLIPAIIFIQSLFFKFTAAPESIYLFEKLGLPDPIFRIGTGVIELIAAILLLVTPTKEFGALIGAGMMVGAIISHFTLLGINVQGDGGLLFALGVVTFICCSIIAWKGRKDIPIVSSLFN